MHKRMHERPVSTEGSGRRSAVCTALAFAALTAPIAAEAATLRFDKTVLSGLVNPRGLAVGPDGALYVAEAGRGGDGPAITAGSGQTVFYGETGAVTRWQGGVQERIAEGLPSLAGPSGDEASGGPQDVAFGANGMLYALIGLGADPAVRGSSLSGDGRSELLGTLISLGNGTPTVVADLAAFEAANDPDGAGADSNPFGLAARDDGFMVTDAGGNDVLSVDGSGAISVEAVLPPASNPLFPDFGPPTYEGVPTGAAVGSDGSLLFGQLTGFPFPDDAAQVFSIYEGTLSTVAGGLTNIIDVAFGIDGTLYALELDSDGLLNPGSTGALYSIGMDGAAQLLFDGLQAPTGLAVGENGRFFVSVNGYSSSDGSVIQLAPVPLPAALPAFLGAFALLGAWRFRRGSRAPASSRS